MSIFSRFQGRPLLSAQAALLWWIIATLALTALTWLAALAGLLVLSDRVRDDVPAVLAEKLPLLQSHPDLIFAGESRTLFQVDPELAAQLLGRPSGSAVNLGYEAGETLPLLAVMRRWPDRFRESDVVVSVAPFLFNEGVRSAAVYPLDVAARLGVTVKMVSFLPLRVGTLIRFIRDAFNTQLAVKQDIADRGPRPAAGGLRRLEVNEPEAKWPLDIGSHPHYTNRDLSGPKARFELGALCDMVALTRKLTVVVPPWSPRYDRAYDPVWREKDKQYVELVVAAGRRCGFDVLNIQAVPGLGAANYADEMHVNASGIPIYTRYLMSRLKP